MTGKCSPVYHSLRGGLTLLLVLISLFIMYAPVSTAYGQSISGSLESRSIVLAALVMRPPECSPGLLASGVLGRVVCILMLSSFTHQIKSL